MSTEFQPYTRYPTEQNNEYKYWGWYGPGATKQDLLGGAFAFFIVLPIIVIGLFALVVLLLVAIAVPPVGIALLTRGDS